MKRFVLLGLLLTGCALHAKLCNPASYEVRGTSLMPIVHPGAVVLVETNRSCYQLARDDLVIYDYAGNEAPLIKRIKAVPGDAWHLDGCHITINNQTLQNEEGTPYCLKDTRRLALYTHDYPIIENDTYLLLGEGANGTLDSSYFGLASQQDIKGKVINIRKTERKVKR